MDVEINGRPAFAHLSVALGPGESILAESGAMASMAGDLNMQARFNGGLWKGLLRKYLGGESLFVNMFTNRTPAMRTLVLSPPLPGDLMVRELKGDCFYLQPGAFLACDPSVQLGLSWAGLVSGIAKEGFFRMKTSGYGRVWFGGYGGLSERDVDGGLIVDTSHLVSYESQLKLKLQFAGGLFSSLFGGEGLVTRVEGRGKIVIQTRSLHTLAGWLSSKVF